jgi:hypothetical protein
MGANAQTTVPTFTAGQTLTAAQVNQINTGIPVASGTATRDGLFGGSGEKTLAEGQLVYVEGLGLQSYNGTAWVTWGVQSAVRQFVNTQTGTVATGTTTIPFDNTIPQITEGTEFMTLAITPNSSTNVLFIQVDFVCSYSIGNTMTAALFQDSTANALAAASEYQTTATGITTISFNHRMVAGTTSATTFRIRAGGETAGTMTFNGISGNQYMGGVYTSSISITEFAP